MKFPKINKRAGGNKGVQVGIFQKINKMCSMIIREVRVGILCENQNSTEKVTLVNIFDLGTEMQDPYLHVY